MANPIKDTPLLTGTDAEQFEIEINKIIPATEKEKEDAKDAFEFFDSISEIELKEKLEDVFDEQFNKEALSSMLKLGALVVEFNKESGKPQVVTDSEKIFNLTKNL